MIPYAEDYKGNIDSTVSETSPYDEGDKKLHLPWHKELLFNQPAKVVVIIALAAVLTPALLYHFIMANSLDNPPSDGYSAGACLLPRAVRLPCGEGNIPASQCHSQCCYDAVNNFCYHRQPSRFSYILDREWTEDLILQPRVAQEPFAFQRTLTSLQLSIDEISKTHLSISFYNPLLVTKSPPRRLHEKNYTYSVLSPEISLEVRSEQGSIFNTNRGPLIASNNIWEIAFELTNETMFGLGELPLSATEKHVVMYNNKDASPSIPLIYARYNNSYHGLLIDVDAPTEIFEYGEHQLVVRSLTNTELKFHLFVGPEPKDIMRDVVDYFRGGRKMELEYWTLGAHICSELSESSQEAYEDLSGFLSQAELEGLPYESHCGAQPLVFNADCSDADYLRVANEAAGLVKGHEKKYLPHVSPFVRYFEEGNETIADERCLTDNYNHLLLSRNNTQTYVGIYEEQNVTFPIYDQLNSKTMLEELWKTDRTIDGVILENAWPTDQSFTWVNETRLVLPYFNQYFEEAFNSTPLWNTTRPDGTFHFANHNKYGQEFYDVMKMFTENQKPVFTSSQYMSLDALIHRQNVHTSWTNLRRQLVEVALGGISGQWLWSSPICGDTESFNRDTQSELCVKWYLASTYFPMIRIQSKDIAKHPLNFTTTHKRLMIKALNVRTSLLPYFYTVLQYGPLLRPMFYEYPNSKIQDSLTQFSVGSDLLIVPDLLPSQSVVHAWMPPGMWYEFWGGQRLYAEEGEPVTMMSIESDFLVLVRGGSIIPMQKDTRLSAEETRLTSPYSLTVALDCHEIIVNRENVTICDAQGHVYIHENLSIHFNAAISDVTITRTGDMQYLCGNSTISNSTIKDISVYGLESSQNNYDHHKYLEVGLDLCELEAKDEIVVFYA